MSSCDSGIPSFRSRVPSFLLARPSIVFDLCRSKGRGTGKRTIRCGPHQRVVNELRRRREKCSFDRHFTRHSGFLSPPSFSILNTFADRFFLRPNRPAQTVRSTPDMICHISTLSICCHITAAENYQENSGGHRQRRQRLLAHPRSSPQPISFNRSKEGRKRGRKEGRKAYHVAVNKIWRDCRVMLSIHLLSLTFEFRVSPSPDCVF